MELRELKYFLAIAREESISKAAECLYITQPSLSRQMQNLEKEIGKPLFIRGSKKISLTQAGILLKKRAEEILELYHKTESELCAPLENISGNIFIGSGESYTIEHIAQTAKAVQEKHPDIQFHFFSQDTESVMEKLDKGLIDFGILVLPADLSKYEYLQLPQMDTWGVLMRKDSPLAQKQVILPEDLRNLPLICSQHAMNKHEIRNWFGQDIPMKVVATYNLLYNASLLVKAGLGYAIGLDKIINTTGESALCFRPFFPKMETPLVLAWKRHQVFSKPAEHFLQTLKTQLNTQRYQP